MQNDYNMHLDFLQYFSMQNNKPSETSKLKISGLIGEST